MVYCYKQHETDTLLTGKYFRSVYVKFSYETQMLVPYILYELSDHQRKDPFRNPCDGDEAMLDSYIT